MTVVTQTTSLLPGCVPTVEDRQQPEVQTPGGRMVVMQLNKMWYDRKNPEGTLVIRGQERLRDEAAFQLEPECSEDLPGQGSQGRQVEAWAGAGQGRDCHRGVVGTLGFVLNSGGRF